MHRSLRSAEDLVEAGLVTADAAPALTQVSERYSISVTPLVARLIGEHGAPLARQYIPSAEELVTAPHELDDPTADAPFTPIKGVVHRYPDRALLKPLLACPVYCRFCFRREAVGPGGGLLGEAELEAALDWFARTPQVREAILTGGDPLMLSPRRLRHILTRLAAIPHIETLRIHSRVPVADPDRVDAAMLDALTLEKPLYLCVHANHAAEFAPESHAALRALHGAGAVLLGQSVLLRGVNDSGAALEDLFRAMLRNRIKPYYLHQLDAAPGTARFHVPVEEGLALLRGLRGRVTGLAWPTYVQERPAGGGKFPLGMEAMHPGTGQAPQGE
ncbi:lysine-2,3-aminomutase-like protein [Roseococcus sp. YIM B11640]|uniref:lysine-2,3-aminomutase-like protein n=1 Tax=Roseococcus sp. YIM B11640 TaxID=3133973 RepID=UPI003C7D7FBF